MKITRRHKEQEEGVELPCLMEFIDGELNKDTPTGIVVLMVEPGKGMIVVTSKKHRDKGYEEGQWRTGWNKRIRHCRVFSYWKPWSGSVTLEND